MSKVSASRLFVGPPHDGVTRVSWVGPGRLLGPPQSVSDLVRVTAQASVATEAFLKALSAASGEASGCDRFSINKVDGELAFKVYRSWNSRQKAVRFSLPFEGTMKKVVGYSDRLMQLLTAPFYDRSVVITFCAPAGEEIYIGKYWLPLVPPERAEIPRHARTADLITKRIAELNARNLVHPPRNIEELASRWERDAELALLLKELRGYACQICTASFKMIGGGFYSECHHLESLASGGLDASKNMLILCANHHRQFHYGFVRVLDHTEEYIVVDIDGVAHRCSLAITNNVEVKRLTALSTDGFI